VRQETESAWKQGSPDCRQIDNDDYLLPATAALSFAPRFLSSTDHAQPRHRCEAGRHGCRLTAHIGAPPPAASHLKRICTPCDSRQRQHSSPMSPAMPPCGFWERLSRRYARIEHACEVIARCLLQVLTSAPAPATYARSDGPTPQPLRLLPWRKQGSQPLRLPGQRSERGG